MNVSWYGFPTRFAEPILPSRFGAELAIEISAAQMDGDRGRHLFDCKSFCESLSISVPARGPDNTRAQWLHSSRITRRRNIEPKDCRLTGARPPVLMLRVCAHARRVFLGAIAPLFSGPGVPASCLSLECRPS